VDFLAELITDFLDEHPRLHIDLQLCSHAAAIGEQADLNIVIGDPGNHSLVARKVGTFQLRVYGSPAYLEKAGAPLAKSDLADHVLLICDLSLPYCPWAKTDPNRSNIEGRLRFNSFRLAAALAADGMGLAVLPHHIAADKVTAGTLTQVLPTWTAGWMPLYIVTTSKLLPMRSRKFIAFATKRLRQAFNGATGETQDDSSVMP
jgi:DNA-binding transcriptional LysR family regulator